MFEQERMEESGYLARSLQFISKLTKESRHVSGPAIYYG